MTADWIGVMLALIVSWRAIHVWPTDDQQVSRSIRGRWREQSARMHAASASVVKFSCAEKSESFEYVNNRPGVERGTWTTV